MLKQLTGADEMWFSLEAPNTPMHFNLIHVYDPSTAPGGRVTHEDILAFIEERLDTLSMREKRVPVPFGLDYSYWVEDEGFDLMRHVRFTTLPAPGDWRQFVQEVQRIIAAPLDISRPLWEIHVAEGLNHVEGFPQGCFAIVHKKHHGQFDGSSATYLMSVMHTLEPTSGTKAASPKRPVSAAQVPSPSELLGRSYWNNWIKKPMSRLNFFNRTLSCVPKAMGAVLQDIKMPQASRTRFSGTIPSPRRVIEARTFPMEEVQNFREDCAGATVNDIVVTVFSGALRKYLLLHDELPKEPVKAMIPVSVRKEEERTTGGNKIFNMVTDIHTEVADPLERMAKVHEATLYSKQVTECLGARNMCEMLELAPLPAIEGSIKTTMRMKIADFIPGLYSGIAISNIPGSKVPLYFCGAKQIRCFNWGFLMDGMGLLFVAHSYCEDLVFTVVSCPEMMPDMSVFGECVQEAFDELRNACQTDMV